jgi:hypothetical protein
MAKSAQHADIERRLKIENAPAWRPNAGDILTGTIVKIGFYEHEEYGKSPVVTMENGDGIVKVYAIHETLASRLFELKPHVGDEITVAYFGQVPSNTRKDAKTNEPVEYHKYSVLASGEQEEEEAPW